LHIRAIDREKSAELASTLTVLVPALDGGDAPPEPPAADPKPASFTECHGAARDRDHPSGYGQSRRRMRGA
jgi:hypothetical protein